MADTALWWVFIMVLSLLWASGAWLFVRSTLSAARKVLWSLVLIGVGMAIGSLLPLIAIRDRLLIILALLPILALVDIRLARSKRTFLFWFRACAFEVCTVFAVAALTRIALSARLPPH